MITKQMVKYWLGSDGSIPKDVIDDFVDIANGKYKPDMLRQDIEQTWRYKKWAIIKKILQIELEI